MEAQVADSHATAVFCIYAACIKVICQETNQIHKWSAITFVSRNGSLAFGTKFEEISIIDIRGNGILHAQIRWGKPAGDAILSSLEQPYAIRYYLLAEEPCET